MALTYLDRVSGQNRRKTAVTVGGTANAIVGTGSDGKIDESFLTISADTVAADTSETLADGDFVNLFSDSGTLKVRKADNSNGREAHGFVKAAFTHPTTATVYRTKGSTNAYSGLTVGKVYLGTNGRVTQTPVSTGVDQELGYAISATNISVDIQDEVIIE